MGNEHIKEVPSTVSVFCRSTLWRDGITWILLLLASLLHVARHPRLNKGGVKSIALALDKGSWILE